MDSLSLPSNTEAQIKDKINALAGDHYEAQQKMARLELQLNQAKMDCRGVAFTLHDLQIKLRDIILKRASK